MAAEAGVDRGLIRFYHKRTLIFGNVAFSLFSAPSIINVILSSDIKNVMRYMFVFEVYIPIVVSS